MANALGSMTSNNLIETLTENQPQYADTQSAMVFLLNISLSRYSLISLKTASSFPLFRQDLDKEIFKRKTIAD